MRCLLSPATGCHDRPVVRRLFLVPMAFALFACGGPRTEEFQVAVASNFKEAMVALEERFEERTGHRATLIFGSTGKLYAQIKNGAPFAVFFAADAERPRQLEKEELALAGSRFTYAIGRLALWSPRPGYVDDSGAVLAAGGYRYLAIANPELAPYGKAAQDVLQSLGLWERLRGRMVRGENVGQAFQFVQSRNAELGFVALAQVRSAGQTVGGSLWVPSRELYAPIEQQAVLLSENRKARAFLEFVRGAEGAEIVRGFGYGTP